MRGLAYRRHQTQKAKKKAFNFLTELWGISDISLLPGKGQIGLWASTHCCPCSCWMCGNWRATEGLTRQELVAVISTKEQIEEIVGSGEI